MHCPLHPLPLPLRLVCHIRGHHLHGMSLLRSIRNQRESRGNLACLIVSWILQVELDRVAINARVEGITRILFIAHMLDLIRRTRAAGKSTANSASRFALTLDSLVCLHSFQKFYQEDVSDIPDRTKWSCPSCRKLCCCAACRRKDQKDKPAQYAFDNTMPFFPRRFFVNF
jgi:hypothetical protein